MIRPGQPVPDRHPDPPREPTPLRLECRVCDAPIEENPGGATVCPECHTTVPAREVRRALDSRREDRA